MTVTRSIPQNRVLIVGASYGGLGAAVTLLELANGALQKSEQLPKVPGRKLRDGIKITVVDERDGYYHTIGSPLALASANFAKKAWVKLDEIPALKNEAVSIAHGSVQSVDADAKVALVKDHVTGKIVEHAYDYLVAASGLRRTWPVVPQELEREKYLKEVQKHIEEVARAENCVVVVGGGAVGIEMAAELKLVFPKQTVKLIHSRDRLLSAEPLPDAFKDTALTLLQDAGVEVVLNERVLNVVADPERANTSIVSLGDGSSLRAGKVIWALSKSIPSTSYLQTHLLDAEGLVKITPNLAFAPDHYVAGDLAAWSGIKRCGRAMNMGLIAAVNIHQQMLSAETGTPATFAQYPEVPPMMGLAVGKKAAVYDPIGGVVAGEELMKVSFGEDLAFDICWNYMKLGNGDYGESEA